jgi:VWFA-related protein
MIRWVALLFAGVLSAAEPQTPEPFQLSVNVDLVVLQATVSGRPGQLVPTLAEDNFAVYEDGVRQTVTLFRHEDIPVTVGLVVDHSGSMRRKLPEVAAAARTFAQASNPRDLMFVVSFNDKVDMPLIHGSPFVSLPEDLDSAILRADAIGMTRLYDAVFQAQQQLQACNIEKKVLMVISDGGDNASTHTLAQVIRNAESSPALIYTIGIFDEYDTDKNKDVLRRLARSTGGEAYFPAHLDATVGICQSIAKDIRNQYTLGYVSTNAAKTGVLRSIRVVAALPGHGKFNVRTRTGYIAGAR